MYLPILRLVSRAEALLRLPNDLTSTTTHTGNDGPTTSSNLSSSSSPALSSGALVVTSWLQHFLDEVVLEQLLPQMWVELRGRCGVAVGCEGWGWRH